MIIKSRPRKTRSFRQLLNYLMDNKGRGLGGKPMILTHNVRGDTVEDWVSSLESNEPKRIRSNATRVLHEIISFHPKDQERLDKHKLEDIARTYIQSRSKTGMFVVIPHLDDDHPHIHICGSPWDMEGESLRMSQAEFQELKADFQKFQMDKYPELVHSKVAHDNKATQMKHVGQAQGMSVKAKVLQAISDAVLQTTSAVTFLKDLESSGFEVYYRADRATGVIFKGRKFRFKTLGVKLDELISLRKEVQLNCVGEPTIRELKRKMEK